MCISTPEVPKYDPPVTMEAPEPEKAPDPLQEPDEVNGEKGRRRANKRGLQQLRTDLTIPSIPKATGGLTIPRS